MSKILILYYSFEGNTKRLADYLAKTLPCDAERIIPVKELQSKGFSKFIWGGKQALMKDTPDIHPLVSDLNAYDTIIIGSPIWASTFAPPIRTLLQSGIIQDKNIHYLYTHEGGFKHAEKNAKMMIEKQNNYMSSFGCEKVKKHFDTLRPDLLNWAKKI